MSHTPQTLHCHMFPLHCKQDFIIDPKGLTCCLALLQLVIERAAAVVGNLSTTDQFFSAIREAGAIQRLVRLLDSGSTHRTTEIAAKTLANLASESSNRKGIRLAGGVPPLMRLLMDRPSEQVSSVGAPCKMKTVSATSCHRKRQKRKALSHCDSVNRIVTAAVTVHAPCLCLYNAAARY